MLIKTKLVIETILLSEMLRMVGIVLRKCLKMM